MSAVATRIPTEEKQKEVERLILETLQELNKPVDINLVARKVYSKNYLAEYEFRSALSHLLAARLVVFDSNRKIKFA